MISLIKKCLERKDLTTSGKVVKSSLFFEQDVVFQYFEPLDDLSNGENDLWFGFIGIELFANLIEFLNKLTG